VPRRLLNVAQPPVRINLSDESTPRFGDDRLVSRAIEHAVIHTPRQGKGDQSGTRGLRLRIIRWVEQIRVPQAVPDPAAWQRLRHLPQLRFIFCAAGSILWHVVQGARNAAHHPAIARDRRSDCRVHRFCAGR